MWTGPTFPSALPLFFHPSVHLGLCGVWKHGLHCDGMFLLGTLESVCLLCVCCVECWAVAMQGTVTGRLLGVSFGSLQCAGRHVPVVPP